MILLLLFCLVSTWSYIGTQEGIEFARSLGFPGAYDPLTSTRMLELEAWMSIHSLRLANVTSTLLPERALIVMIYIYTVLFWISSIRVYYKP